MLIDDGVIDANDDGDFPSELIKAQNTIFKKYRFRRRRKNEICLKTEAVINLLLILIDVDAKEPVLFLSVTWTSLLSRFRVLFSSISFFFACK